MNKEKDIIPGYRFQDLIEVDKEYRLAGLNIWSHYWQCSDRSVEVVGPFEHQIYSFKEYEIKTPEKSVKFVAGEFSNGKIGIFVKEDQVI